MSTEPPQRPRHPARPGRVHGARRTRLEVQAPLYDPAFEHDACGIGFVADAGGHHLADVLPLALGGLAALAHRGAFGADGASSDGAGVSLPLEASVLEALAPGAGLAAGRPAVLQLFLPRSSGGARGGFAARRLVSASLAGDRLTILRWRSVPTDPDALGAAARSVRPAFVQAFIARPVDGKGRPLTDAAFERRLVLARRRIETAVRSAGFGDTLAIPSASCRTIVYKGLVAGARLADLYPDLRSPGIRVRYALFHQRYATNTQPTWRLAQPFRAIAHNGEINTVRGNRSQVRGRTADPAGPVATELAAAGPLVNESGSDSQSLDELLELLVSTGWDLGTALLTVMPEALPLRRSPHPQVAALRRRVAGFIAPWDGPAAIVFGDGRQVGAIADRNGLRPTAFAVTRDRLVAVCSEAGAIPLAPEDTVRRGRLGPGELFLVDPGRGLVLEDVEAKAHLLRRLPIHDAPRHTHADPVVGAEDSSIAPDATPTGADLRFLAGLHAENARLDIKTMALEGHEPLWSMGDDTPTAGLGRIDRPVADHLRQAFAQVTNPPIDPERERAVMDLRVELGRRPALLGGPPAGSRTIRLERPFLADLPALLRVFGGPIRRLDATWPAAAGPAGLGAALDRLATEAVAAAHGRTELVVLSDRSFSLDRLPIPSVLAAGAVDAALSAAGLRGRADVVVEAADVLDVHGAAMVLAVGATGLVPWLAIEMAAELAGTRGAEELDAAATVANLLAAFDAGLRKTLARMGISTASSYIGGKLFETIELDDELRSRCFPAAPAWPGRIGIAELAERQLRRRAAALAVAPLTPSNKLQDPGFARFRADGEVHRYAPRIVAEIQDISGFAPVESSGAVSAGSASRPPESTVVRDALRVRRPRGVTPIPVAKVEDARSIVRRFVVSAMSVGALSPEAHQALTIGIQRAGGAANTGEGGEDPGWYVAGSDGERHDARIKQVASARFGVTSTYLARGEQLEIKIAQGSKPGEGGQLPAKKATAWIAALRRGQPGMSYISPPPHHDIYSIEDLAQLIADLRAINPTARIGVKLVAARGVGTIAAGVAKAGATYIHLAGHSGGTGASPLSSIKHVGAPWELGLAEVHQTLLRNGLRDRVALRTDGGLRTGRDLLVAALLGAEEFAFGTAMLVAVGCDMARQCHLDTCPTGIATQREDLRAKFAGAPEQVARFALALAERLREELAAVGVRSVGELVGESRRFLTIDRRAATLDLDAVIGAGSWAVGAARRADPASAGQDVRRGEASPLERRLASALHGQSGFRAEGLALSTADRSFGAGLTGAIERSELGGPIHLGLRGAAGQSFGAFAGPGVELRLVGQANDYVAKGLSGGVVVVTPEPGLAAEPRRQAIAGNTCLYGATGGRLHLVGRAGMRFAVRNSGARAVVEGLGPHGCEYMTGGVVAVLGPVGANFGAGMTGGRAYLYDPDGRHLAALDARSVRGSRLSSAVAARPDGAELTAEIIELLAFHREAGSALAARLLSDPAGLVGDTWLVEPIPAAAPAVDSASQSAARVLVPVVAASGSSVSAG